VNQLPGPGPQTQERNGEAVLLSDGDHPLPEEDREAVLLPDIPEEAVLVLDESLENQVVEEEAGLLGDETELVKSLAELDSHMDQVMIKQCCQTVSVSVEIHIFLRICIRIHIKGLDTDLDKKLSIFILYYHSYVSISVEVKSFW